MAKKKRSEDEPKKKKKKAAPRDEDEVVDEADDDDDGDDGYSEPKKGSRNDAYVGLLAITLLALIAASVMFYLDFTELSASPVQSPSFTVPGLGGSTSTTPAAPAAAPPAPAPVAAGT
ncbi:hypothetical protein [Fimbriiglobus ruber]|uniref:Uncharacterized protein n=1 Tax=Fimbriiglobus ruber TaxID=1908690 RepID=A0A225DJ51_9BACT|nr:hypothetical protein [Fimbriiglobus ruber]OWK36405.1 hypothetical protein FRUB_08968 [Fimbriiglobus ruber]